MSNTIAGITMPDSEMARDLTQLIRDTASDLLFHHSTWVYLSNRVKISVTYMAS
jgi:hypothetical protein